VFFIYIAETTWLYCYDFTFYVVIEVTFWKVCLFTLHFNFFLIFSLQYIQNISLLLAWNCCDIKSDILFMYNTITLHHKDAWRRCILKITFQDVNMHYTVLGNGNKHLSKNKNTIFSLKIWRNQLKGWRHHPNLWLKQFKIKPAIST